MTVAAQRHAFVTGSAQGLGAAIARALHAAGHRVTFADVNHTGVERVVDSLQSKNALAVEADVLSPHSIHSAVGKAEEAFGPIEILVNNAALTRARDFFEMTLEEWDDVLSVNLRSIVVTCQVIAPGMLQRRWGRILNLTSVAGQRGGPQVQGAHYASSKAAIIGLTRYLAHQFASSGVTVNAVAPGPIETEQTRLAPPEKLAQVASQIPIGRLGKTEEVGSLATYLASDLAGFMTGATIDINGGLIMR